MGASTGLTVLIGLPAIALVVLSFWVGWLVYLAVAVGLITGILTIRAGIRTGGRRLDRRWPEVLTRVTATT
jgi:ABC-2 type transport system permease protein